MVRKRISQVITALYTLIIAGIMIGTLLLDKNLSRNLYPNTAKWANGGYYLIAAILAGSFIILYIKNNRKKISDKTYRKIIFIIFLVTLIFQTIVAAWAPEITGSMSGDFGSIHDMAINLANGGSFEGNEYFKTFQHNVFITILFSLIYRAAGNWHVIIWMGALLTNLSVVMMAYVIRKLSGSKFAAIILCAAGEILIAINWRSFIAYTDNWGMPFTIGIISLIYSDINRYLKAPLLLFVALLGACIKITAVIPLLAYLIYMILNGQRIPFRSFCNKKGIASLFACLLIIVFGGYLITRVPSALGYQKGDDSYDWQYFFMVGQNEGNTGQVGSNDYFLAEIEIKRTYEDRNSRNRAYLDTALKWISRRGILGNIGYYTRVLTVTFNDGRFHNVQPYDHDSVAHNIIYEFYSYDGKYYPVYSEIAQIVWDFFLLLLFFEILLAVWTKNNNTEYLFFFIAFLGLIAYLFLFENRSKYLFMFLPVIGTISGLMLVRMFSISLKLFNIFKNNPDRLKIIE